MAGRDWQVVYRDPNKSDIITVWMTDYYTSAVFNSSKSSGNNYNGSNIQTTVKNYFNTQANTYPVLNNITVSPNAMSNSYKTAQDQNGSYGGYASSNGAISSLTDKFWLPSLYEAFSFWGLDNTDRSSSGSCWLRSGNNLNNNYYALSVYSSGSADYYEVSNSWGVRPAAHLSLSKFAEYAKFKIETKTNNDAIGTTSGDGLFSANGTGSATITATSNYGYVFEYWIEESTGNKIYSNPYTFTVTKNETYTAYFVEGYANITTENNRAEILEEKILYDEMEQRISLSFFTSNYLTQIKFSGDSVPRTLKSASAKFVDVANCTAVEYTTNTEGSKLYISVLAPTDSITITLYFTNTAQNYQATSGGGGVETVAVQSTIGGSAELVGDNYTNLTSGDTITVVARFKLNGYQFDGWFIDGELITTDMSARLTYDDIKGKVIVAQFSKIDSNANTETETDHEFV